MEKIKNNNNENYSTYYGEKGYSIFKECLSIDEQHFIRNELTVQAFVPKSPVQYPSFPIYLESPLKLYIPRYFGIDTYGPPDKILIEPGDNINVEFQGELRQYQIDIVEKYIKHVGSFGGGLLDVDPGKGKTVMALNIISRLKKSTLVVVHKSFLLNQWKERIQQFLPTATMGTIQGQIIDIKDKDIVIGMLQSLSMKEYPKSIFRQFGLVIFDECFPYKTYIHTSIGIVTIGQLYEKWNNNQDLPFILSFNEFEKIFEYKKLTHAWKKEREDLIKIKLSKRVINCTPEHKIMTIDGYKEAIKLNIGDLILCKYDIRHNEPNNFNIIAPCLNEDQLQLIYGSYLGDGCIYKTSMNRYRVKIIHGENQYNYCKWKASMFGINDLNCLENNGLSNKKAYQFITKVFDLKFNVNITNSSCENNVCDNILQNMNEKGLAIWFMDNASTTKNKKGEINSVRFKTQCFNYESQLKFVNLLKNKFDIDCKIYKCSSSKISKKYKKYNYLMLNKENSKKLINIVKRFIHENLYYKLENTIIDNKYIWNYNFENYGTIPVSSIERIKNKGSNRCKTPNVYDIEVEQNHNFIIATSSKSKNEYIDGMVVSNCHHMGAEVFSRCMMKVNTTYALGLSGTMQRKDGLTKVFEWFLGPVVHKEKTESEHKVLVKGIVYYVDDEEFNKTLYDYKGNPKFSTMISNVCNYNHRSEFILRVLIRELELNSDQQIMVLAHNKSLISYLFHAIEHRNIANGSVGLYIGGMKEVELKKSEVKKIIIATYAMASEGLDIKSLTTLVLASPKTDVCQSVGRILRQKHSSPLIIDIIDSHDIFMSQWLKRRKYYKSQNYRILLTDNKNYDEDLPLEQWKVSNEPNDKTKKGKKNIIQNKTKLDEIIENMEKINIDVNDIDFEEEEQELEKKKKASKKRGGLENKCLIDISSLQFE